MTVWHVVMNLDEASGVVTFACRLHESLQAGGIASRILSESDPLPSAIGADVVHIHGVWRPYFHQVALLARRQGVPVVWSPHGMLAPWALRHKRWKKRLAWWLYQRADLRTAGMIHVTSEQERQWVEGLRLGVPTVLAPLGTMLPGAVSEGAETKRLLFVGRLHPVKAIDLLVEALARVPETVRAGWTLRVVGPEEDADYAARLKRLAGELGVPVDFAGPKYGADLDSEYASCAALCLVSHTENFGATVVDALAHGKLVVTGTKTPWREVADRGCGWWTDNEPDRLSVTLGDLMRLSESARKEMGMRGRRLVEEKYTWGAVARTLARVYQEVK